MVGQHILCVAEAIGISQVNFPSKLIGPTETNHVSDVIYVDGPVRFGKYTADYWALCREFQSDKCQLFTKTLGHTIITAISEYAPYYNLVQNVEIIGPTVQTRLHLNRYFMDGAILDYQSPIFLDRIKELLEDNGKFFQYDVAYYVEPVYVSTELTHEINVSSFWDPSKTDCIVEKRLLYIKGEVFVNQSKMAYDIICSASKTSKCLQYKNTLCSTVNRSITSKNEFRYLVVNCVVFGYDDSTVTTAVRVKSVHTNNSAYNHRSGKFLDEIAALVGDHGEHSLPGWAYYNKPVVVTADFPPNPMNRDRFAILHYVA